MTDRGDAYSVDTLDKGMIRIPGRQDRDGTRFHHTTQNGVQFKTYDWFLSGIFYLIFSGCCWLQLIETVESKSENTGDCCAH